MDPLHFCIAVGPLAMYLLILGLINLRRRPMLTSGSRDLGALGVAISGFVVAGPIELFIPTTLPFGRFTWVMMLVLYALTVILIILMSRPRIVIYNVQPEQLRTVLAEVVQRLDESSRWAGDALSVPALGIQLYLEAAPGLRNAQLKSAGPKQDFQGWHKLESELAQALKEMLTPRNYYALPLLAAGITLIVSASVWMCTDKEAVAQALDQMFYH